MRNSLKYGIALAFTGLAAFAGAAFAAEDALHPKSQKWSHHGPFGTFDRATLQRGLLVYEHVCATCHALEHLAYRNLEGIGFSEDEVKGYAAQFMVEDGPNEDGDMFERPALASDKFRDPYANDEIARLANNGALPPDLTLIVEARGGHEDYIYSLMTGYQDPPAGVELQPGMSYNPYFPGGQIAMPPPLVEGIVEYPDGTEATAEQMAHDVTVFLAWAAEPNMEERKEAGFKVIVFMIILSGLLIASNRRIWKKLKAQNA